MADPPVPTPREVDCCSAAQSSLDDALPWRDAAGAHRRARCAVQALSLLGIITIAGHAGATDFDPADERPARIGYEALGGIVGLGAGAGVFFLGTAALLRPPAHAREGGFGLGVVLAGAAVVGGFIGEGVGVYLGGRWSGGNGSYWGTLGGQSLGVLAGAGLLLLVLPEVEDSTLETVLWSFALGALPMAGAIAGYELTTSRTSATGSTSQALIEPPAIRWPLLGWSQAF